MADAASLPRRSCRKMLIWSLLAIFLLPAFSATGLLAYHGGPTHWSQWDRAVQSRLSEGSTFTVTLPIRPV